MSSDSDNGSLVAVAGPALVEAFGALVTVMFSLKDRSGRYVAVNQAFVARSGRRSTREVLGATAHDLFPVPLADRYAEQDRRVMSTGRSLRDELELIRRPDGSTGWYVTTKAPVIDPVDATVLGVASVSRDLQTPQRDGEAVRSLAFVIDHVAANLERRVRPSELAEVAGCSPAQLDRRMRTVFGLSPTRYVQKARVDRAAELLADGDLPIARIAAETGFYDQADLTRQFARTTGETPAQFRARHR